MSMVADRTRQLYEQDELPEELLWINDLSPRHQRIFYGEVQHEWARYCLSGNSSSLDEFFDDWKTTSEADGNPEHSAYLLKGEADDDYEEWQTKAIS